MWNTYLEKDRNIYLIIFIYSSCTASCDPGYQFPNGLTYDKRECDQMFGEWFDPPGKDIPDCVRKLIVDS